MQLGLDRDWEDLEYARKLSEIDLPAVIVYIIDVDIKSKLEKGKQIHLNSIIARNELLKNKN